MVFMVFHWKRRCAQVLYIYRKNKEKIGGRLLLKIYCSMVLSGIITLMILIFQKIYCSMVLSGIITLMILFQKIVSGLLICD